MTLASPPDALIQYGVLHFVALHERLAAEYPDLRPSVAVDCGDRADLAHDAMRLGLKALVFRGDPAVSAKLAAIAREIGVHFEAPNPRSAGAD